MSVRNFFNGVTKINLVGNWHYRTQITSGNVSYPALCSYVKALQELRKRKKKAIHCKLSLKSMDAGHIPLAATHSSAWNVYLKTRSAYPSGSSENCRSTGLLLHRNSFNCCWHRSQRPGMSDAENSTILQPTFHQTYGFSSFICVNLSQVNQGLKVFPNQFYSICITPLSVSNNSEILLKF